MKTLTHAVRSGRASLRARRNFKRIARTRILTNAELTRTHWADRRTFRWLGVMLAMFLAAGIGFGLSQNQRDTKTQRVIEQLRYVQMQQAYDRCTSGNEFRIKQKDINVGFVSYIDNLLAGFAKLAPAHNPTPEELAAGRSLAETRQSQLDKNNDPALAPKTCPSKPVAPR